MRSNFFVTMPATLPLKARMMSMALLPIVLAALFLCSGCNKPAEKSPDLTGAWIGTLEMQPYPDLVYLYIDSVSLVRCYYLDVQLQPIQLETDPRGIVRFTIDDIFFQGVFEGEYANGQLNGTLTTEGQAVPCQFMRLSDGGGMFGGAGYAGYYQLAEGHVVEVTPFVLDHTYATLSLLDFKTGWKRIAFASGPGTFTFGERMMAPMPAAGTLQFALDADSLLTLTYTAGGETLTGKRLPDLTEEVAVEARNGSISLQGTLTYPEGDGPHPLLIWVPAGGSSQFRGNLFDDFIKLLPYYGMATLVYDKRGCGASSGDVATATLQDFASDARAWLLAAGKWPRIDQRRLGLAGIDQAGSVIPLVAAQSDKPAYAAILSGNTLTMEAQEYHASAKRMAADGFSQAHIQEAQGYLSDFFAFLKKEMDSAAFFQRHLGAPEAPWAGYVTDATNPAYLAWWRKNREFTVLPQLTQTRIPVWMGYGENDLIASPAFHTPVLDGIWKNPESQVKIYPGANHLLLLGETRGDFQWTEITGYPEHLFTDFHGWLLKQAGLLPENP